MALEVISDPHIIHDEFMRIAATTLEYRDHNYADWEPIGDQRLEKNQVHPHARVFDTGRDFEDIAKTHHMTNADLTQHFAGKVVLDVGCGYSELGEEANVDTTVIGLDLPTAFEKEKDYFAEERKNTFYVAGNGRTLPFADQTFDTILSTYALLEHLYSGEQGVQFLEEALRVLKIGGTALIAPIHPKIAYVDGAEGTARVLHKIANLALDDRYKMSYRMLTTLQIKKIAAN